MDTFVRKDGIGRYVSSKDLAFWLEKGFKKVALKKPKKEPNKGK